MILFGAEEIFVDGSFVQTFADQRYGSIGAVFRKDREDGVVGVLIRSVGPGPQFQIPSNIWINCDGLSGARFRGRQQPCKGCIGVDGYRVGVVAPLSKPFVASEEECLVADDRSSERATELVPREVTLAQLLTVIGPGICIQA